MKDVRDIRLLGIGFVAGMVLCYFLTLDAPKPPVGGTVAMTLAQAASVSPVTNLVPAQLPFEANQGKSSPMWLDEITLRKFGQQLFDTREAPDFKREQRLRIEPALKIKNASPGGVPQYDLIDLNYKPDFKLPD